MTTVFKEVTNGNTITMIKQNKDQNTYTVASYFYGRETEKHNYKTMSSAIKCFNKLAK